MYARERVLIKTIDHQGYTHFTDDCLSSGVINDKMELALSRFELKIKCYTYTKTHVHAHIHTWIFKPNLVLLFHFLVSQLIM